eukprot:Cvel_34808.t1-p1 / transcript=Cvel_34808.t1 / gene=Cvel_34808 / organism=Chromera_velia_CCMP2878 / gene_product=hypothetical protein / transcript_product=hypothetical protein / location=Cvel_scaffold6103:1190-3499(+) / protein_length=387 / sequence_SO=supercontig / SO=protein_coding / is_pseudo=false
MQTALLRETEKRAACQIQAAFRGFKGRKIAHSQRHMMVFRWPYNDPKSQVVVMGDFTKSAWGRQHRMAWCEARGGHVVELPLPPNDRVVQFKFIVDGRWVYDIKKPTINDGQGNTNNLQTWGSDIAKDPFRAKREERKRLAAENRRQFLLSPPSQDKVRGQIELEVEVDALKKRLQDAEKDLQAEKQRVVQVEETARNEREGLQKSLQQAEAEKESLQTEMAAASAVAAAAAAAAPAVDVGAEREREKEKEKLREELERERQESSMKNKQIEELERQVMKLQELQAEGSPARVAPVAVAGASGGGTQRETELEEEIEHLSLQFQPEQPKREELENQLASEVALYTFPAEGGPPPGFPATFETSPAEISNGAAFFSPQVENSGGETDD